MAVVPKWLLFQNGFCSKMAGQSPFWQPIASEPDAPEVETVATCKTLPNYIKVQCTVLAVTFQTCYCPYAVSRDGTYVLRCDSELRHRSEKLTVCSGCASLVSSGRWPELTGTVGVPFVFSGHWLRPEMSLLLQDRTPLTAKQQKLAGNFTRPDKTVDRYIRMCFCHRYLGLS